MTTMMKRVVGIGATTIALGLLAALPAGAQDKPTPTPTPTPPPAPSKVEVVISRYQGEKKISSQPYVLMPTATRSGGYVSLRVGVDVPVGVRTTTRPAEGGREGQTTTAPEYQRVGTNLDCQVSILPDGRYSVMVNVTDSSIFNPDSPNSPGKPSENAAIRTFQASNTLTMRDGQTLVLVTGTDKVTGETIKIDVTFSLLK